VEEGRRERSSEGERKGHWEPASTKRKAEGKPDGTEKDLTETREKQLGKTSMCNRGAGGLVRVERA